MHAGDVKRTVLVVDDHPIFRRGLSSILGLEPWVDKVHEAADADAAVRIAVTQQVDVVSMDLRLKSDNLNPAAQGGGLQATRELLRVRPQATVLVLTMVMDEDLVAEALASGARGYLLKSAEPEDVVEALHLVAGGGVVLGAGVGPAVLRGPTGTDWPPPFDTLTDRERRLAQLLSVGRSNAFIARQLGISDKTVRNQISALLVRLAVPDRVAVALLARERGLSPGSPSQ
jgi:DNA-binding NarL/FixJ family response regulator